MKVCQPGGPQRTLFGLAGVMTLASITLAATVSPWLLVLTAFVGVNQLLYATTGACPASLVLARMCRREVAR